jgi:uncharacterized protein (TIGR02284 family)
MADAPTNASVESTVSTLNDLIQACKDGENGYRTAAEVVADSNLRHLFLSYSQQREDFAVELQREVRRLAEDPTDTGHVTPALQRGWMEIKAGLIQPDEAAIIAECERGEDAAVQAYRKGLDSDLPTDVHVVVERQFLEVKDAHDYMRSLERTHGEKDS